MDNRIHEFSKKNSRKRLLKRAVSLLCVVVLLFTMNTLKRRANTLERIPACGLEEHLHSSACYNEAGETVCGLQEHVHTDACYQESPKKKRGTKGDLDITLDGYDNTGDLIESGDVQNLDISLDLDQGDLINNGQNSGNDRGSENVMAPLDGDLQLDIPDKRDEQRVANNAAGREQEVTLEFADERSESTGRTAANMQPVIDQPVADQPAEDAQQPAADQPAEDAQQPVEDAQQPVADQPAEDAQQPAADQPAEDAQQPAADQPAEDAQQPAADLPAEDAQQPAADQPAADQPAEDAQQPAADQPAEDAQQPVADQPAEDAQQPAADQPAEDAQQPATDQPAEDAQQPAADQPAIDQQPADDQPAIDQQITTDEQQQPAADQPAAEQQPADDQPAIDQQITTDDQQQPTADQPAAEQQPAEQQPADDQLAIDQQITTDDQQQPVTDQPADAQQPAADQPAIDQQITTDDQQQPAEDQPADVQQPAGDQLAIDQQITTDDQQQPVTDQPADAQQPAADQQPADDQPAIDQQITTDEQQQPAVDQPAEDAQQPTDDQQTTADQPAATEQQPEDDQPSDTDQQPSVDQPSVDQHAEDAQQPAADQPAVEQPAEDAQQPTDDQQTTADQPAAAAQQQPEGDQPSDTDQQPAERHYAATVNLADTKTYPISLRAVIANAVPAQETNNESNDAEAATLPVGEWSVDFDSGLFEVETTEDDILLTPLADFESAEIELYNGSSYALTLVNCVLEQPKTEAAPEAEIAYPAQHFEDSTAYISVVVDAPVGALPEGTVMVVRDVVDQGTIDNIEQSVTEDFVEVKSVHAVDITFLYNNVEIEPKQLISVEMREVKAEEPKPQQDTMVVHVDNDGTAQVVNSEAVDAENAPAAQPTAQAFEADAFSVYALVKVEKIETKYIDDAGDTWSIKLVYSKEAKIPDGATLQVAEVKDESYLNEAEAALESGKRITKARFFDIKIMYQGHEIQPQDTVQVVVSMDGDEGTVETDMEPTEVGDPEVCAMHFVEQNDEVVKVEKQKAKETDDGVQFNAEGFSVWGVVYTVDFTYVDEQGKEHFWQFKGTGSHKISEVLAQLGIEAEEITAVDLVRTETIGEFGEKDLYLTQDENGEWWINSDAAFDDTYELTVIAGGQTYIITVTDAAGDSYHTVNISVADDADWTGHLYYVLKQEGVSWYQNEWNHGEDLTQYCVGEIPHEGGQLNVSAFKAQYNGAQDNPYDNSKQVTASVAINTHGMSQELDSSTPITYADGVTYVTEINGKQIVISTDNNSQTTTITIGDSSGSTPTPTTYTANISGTNFTASDVAGYYLLAKNDSEYLYYAPLNNLTAGYTNNSGTTSTMTGTITGFDIVKYSETPSLDTLKNLPKLGTGSTVGKSGGFYTVTFPDAADESNVYQFSAEKQPDSAVSLNFTDTSDVEVSGGVTPDGTYYLVAKLNGQYAFYAPVSGAKGTLAFLDDNNASTTLPYAVGNNYVFVKPSAQVSSLAGLSSADEVEALQTTDGKSYVLQDTNSAARVAKETAPVVVESTATISGDSFNAADVAGYYLLARDSSGDYLYYAPLGNPTAYTDENGENSNTMLDVVGFDIVKYDGTPSLSALSAVTEKLGTGCTVGKIDGFYWINFPEQASSENVYAFTAVKQAEAAVTLAFKDTNNDDATVTLDGSYYIIAKLNGERAFYAPVVANTLEFRDASGNPIAKLPQGVGRDYEIVKANSAPANLAGLQACEVVTTMGNSEGTKEYYLDAAGAPGLVAREVDASAPLGDTHTTTVRFFDSNVTWSIAPAGQTPGTIDTAATDQIVPDPALDKYYYVLATVEKTTSEYNSSTGNFEDHTRVYWAVKPINLRDLTASSASVTFNAFQTMDVVNGQTQPSEEGIHFLNKGLDAVTTRLIHSDIPLDVSAFTCVIQDSKYMLSTTAAGANLSDQPENGYRFATGWNGTDNLGNSANEIHLYRTENQNRYKIRLRFSPGSDKAIHGDGDGNSQDSSKYYYVMAEIRHANSGTSYAYANVEIPNPSALDMDDDGYYYKDYEFTNWYDYNGNQRSDSFTGHEQGIEVRFVRCLKMPKGSNAFTPQDLVDAGTWNMKAGMGQIYNELDELDSYTIHYDTRESRHSSAYYKEEGEDDVVWCYDVINMTARTASNDYDYTTILGPNLVYGIVAEHLYQPNHLQTNFAVNHFSGHGHDVRPDLSGNSAGNIVIAQFNESDGSKRNSVGNVAYDPVWGRLKVGKPLKGTLFTYVDQDSGYPEGSVYDNPDDTVVVPMDGKYLSENIVEPGIEYGKRISAELLAKPATVGAQISGNKAVIDTTGFEEYDTIYVDGDLLVDYIGSTGGLEIKKRDHQTIVFNFDNKVTSRNITIKKFKVIQPSFKQYGYEDGYSTDSPEATGSDQNKVMDDIARHIVWNLDACVQKVTIDTAGGIFLQPNDDSEIEIAGTTAGWIVSDGYVYNGNAEWHNVFEEMPESISVNLSALKYVDNRVPAVDTKFNFLLEKLDFTHYSTTGKVNTYTWRELDRKSNNLAQVKFDTIRQDSRDLQVGWNIFRISEIGSHADNTGHFITDTTKYYAAVLVQEYPHVDDDKQLHVYYRVEQPRYYTSFDEQQFQPFLPNEDAVNPVLTGVGEERVAIPAFRNETVTTGLTLMKRVDGTDLTNKKFTFKVKLWTEASGMKSALTMQSVEVSGRAPIALTPETDASGSWSAFEIELKNGQKVTFEGLTEGVHYEFTEIKVGNKEINATNADENGYIDGYKPLTFTDDGQGNITYAVSGHIDNVDDVTAKTFVNEYKSKGGIDLHVQKALQGRTLLDNMFTFTLTGGKTPVVGFNDADGNVTFDALPGGKLTFDQTDMAGATKNEDGYLVKEITYVLREGKGQLSDADVNTAWKIDDFSYENVVYDDDKIITLVLTDMGNGVITVHPKNTRDNIVEVNFNNAYKEKGHTHFEGSKVLEGRPITKAEFTFDAVLTSIDNVNVPTEAQIAAAANDEAREALKAQRAAMVAKVSSANVIGTNEAKAQANEDNADAYTASITFPEIYFAEPGTYVYTVTENTSNMPADTEVKAGSTTSYTATVVVTEVGGKLVAAEPEYSPTPMTFENQTKSIGFNVTKQWLGEGNSALTGVKSVSFSLTYNIEHIQFAENSGSIAQVGGSGSVTAAAGVGVDEDGNITLTCDESGNWPTAQFTGMRAGRYVVTETDHTDVDGDVATSYEMTVQTGDPENPTETHFGNIARNDGDLVTIKNKASTKRKGSIIIKKVWTADGMPYEPDDGAATFQLWYHKEWDEQVAGGTDKVVFRDAGAWSDELGRNVYQIDKEASIGEEFVVTYNVVLNDSQAETNFKNNIGSPVLLLAYGEDAENCNGQQNVLGVASDVSIHYKNYEVTGGDTYPKTATVTFVIPTSGNVTVGEIEYPIKTEKLKGIKLKNTQNMNYGTWSIKNVSVRGVTKQSKEDAICQVNGKSTFTITKNDIVNGEKWTKQINDLMMSDTGINATWTYYVKEIINPSNTAFSVTYSPADLSGNEDRSGTVVNGGVITVTNNTDSVDKKVVKAWEPAPAAGTTIQLSLYAGTTEAAAAASTRPVRMITLDGEADNAADANHNRETPGWTANFNDLPKYDTAGVELVYVVKETQGDNDYIVTYGESDTATYVVTSDAADTENVATIHNAKANGALKLTKITTVDGNEPIKDKDGKIKFVAGTYLFTVVGPDHLPEEEQITKYVLAEVQDDDNGEAAVYYIADEDLSRQGDGWGPWYSAYENGKATRIDGSSAKIDGLEPGYYVITEQTPSNGTALVNAVRGDHTGTTPTGAVPVTVHVTAGKTAEADLLPDAQATFTNNYTTGTLKLKKVVQVDGTAPSGSNQTLTDGTYEFYVYGYDTKYYMQFEITITNGQMSGARYFEWSYDPDNPEAEDGWVRDEWHALSELPSASFDPTDGITITGLEHDQYDITEVASNPSNPKVVMTLQSIDVTPDVDTTQMFLEEKSVLLRIGGESETTVAAVTFTNGCGLGSLSLRKNLQVSSSLPLLGLKEYAEGTYSFTVEGPLALNETTNTYESQTGTKTRYVKIRYDNYNTHYYSKVSDTDSNWESVAETDLISDPCVRIPNLAPGYYRVRETGSQLTHNPEGTESYLKAIKVVDASGADVTDAQSLDLEDQSVVVEVLLESSAEVCAEFTNEVAPSTPGIKKLVADINDTNKTTGLIDYPENPWYDSADHDLTDLIPYRVSGFLPQKIYRSSTVYKYQVVDEMENLNYVEHTGRMYAFVKGPSEETGTWYDVTSYFLPDSGDFTTTQSGNIQTLTTKSVDLKTISSCKLVQSWDATGTTHANQYQYAFGEPKTESGHTIVANDIQYLQFRYRARFTDSVVIGRAGNKNDAQIVYSYTKRDGTVVSNSTERDRNRVFTYQLTVNKTNEDDGTAVSGAQFELYKKYCAYDSKSGDKQYSVGKNVFVGDPAHLPVADKSGLQNADATMRDVYVPVDCTASGSSFTWKGIDDGEYMLIETKAPDGFEPLSDPIWFSIHATHEEDDEDPELTSFTFKPDTAYESWFAAVKDGSVEVKGDEIGTVPNIPYRTYKVRKTWADGQYPEGAQVTIALSGTANGAPVELGALGVSPLTVVLNGGKTGGNDTSEKAWEYTWTDLPKYDGDHHEITYSAAETAYKLGTIDLTDQLAGALVPGSGSDATANLILTNKLPQTTFTADKQWQKRDGTALTPEENTQIVFQLRQYRQDATDAEQTFAVQPVTLDGTVEAQPATLKVSDAQDAEDSPYTGQEATAWHYTWNNLPRYYWDATDGAYKEYVYKVEEVSVAYGGAAASAVTAVNMTLDGKFLVSYDADGKTVINRMNDTPFEFTKQWRKTTTENEIWPTDNRGNQIPIVVTLRRRLASSDNSAIKVTDPNFAPTAYSLTPTSHEGWAISGTAPEYKFTMTGLQYWGNFTIPQGQENAGEYSGVFEYYVTEENLDFYTTTYLDQTDSPDPTKHDALNGWIIRNTEMQTVQLPATGGAGTGALYGAGAGLILLALLGMILLNKKRGEGAGIR